VADAAPQVTKVFVPRDNVSDDVYRLLSWEPADGEVVDEGDVLGDFETSKAVFEIAAERAGVFHPLVTPPREVAVNDLVAVIAPTKLTESELRVYVEDARAGATAEAENAGAAEVPAESSHAPPGDDGDAENVVRFSAAAEALIVEHGLDRAAFTRPGLVRKLDVERMLTQEEQPSVPVDAPVPPVHVLGSWLVVVGAGGHGRVLLDLLAARPGFRIAGFLDAQLPEGTLINGTAVLGPDDDEQFARLHAQGLRLAVNGVGGIEHRSARPAVWEKIRAAGFGLPNLIHPTAAVDGSAQLGEGVQVLAGASAGANSQVGDDCILNTNVVVSHDCVIGDHAHLAPGAVLAGAVHVGANSLVGMGVTAYLGVSIGREAIITNGVSLVTDVPAGSIVRDPQMRVR
jgi:sugar O-acyltransferase (sialic acid O-acetyltransferase NeuD family)